jgi:hypothetical protein
MWSVCLDLSLNQKIIIIGKLLMQPFGQIALLNPEQITEHGDK